MQQEEIKETTTEEKTEEIIRNDRYLLKCLEEDNINIDDIINFLRIA